MTRKIALLAVAAAALIALSACASGGGGTPTPQPGKTADSPFPKFTVTREEPAPSETPGELDLSGLGKAKFVDARTITFSLGGSGSETCAPSVETVTQVDDTIELKLRELPANVMCTMDLRFYGFKLTADADVFTPGTKLVTIQGDTENPLPFSTGPAATALPEDES